MTISPSFCKRVSCIAGAIGGAVLLSACSSAQSSVTKIVDDAIHTASGKISDVKDRAQQAVKPVLDTIDDAQKRIDAVGSGIIKLQQGMEQVKGAVKH